jgi:hypothetical protein
MPEFDIQPIDENAILKDLWQRKEVETRTELQAEQVKNCNKLGGLQNITGNSLIEQQLQGFMTLQISLNRKSRAEFVDFGKAKREADQAGSKFKQFMFG